MQSDCTKVFFSAYFLQQKQTPLHLASQYGQLTAVGLLSELGASLDATDDFGQKPIHLAAQSNRLGNLATLG